MRARPDDDMYHITGILYARWGASHPMVKMGQGVKKGSPEWRATEQTGTAIHVDEAGYIVVPDGMEIGMLEKEFTTAELLGFIRLLQDDIARGGPGHAHPAGPRGIGGKLCAGADVRQCVSSSRHHMGQVHLGAVHLPGALPAGARQLGARRNPAGDEGQRCARQRAGTAWLPDASRRAANRPQQGQVHV